MKLMGGIFGVVVALVSAWAIEMPTVSAISSSLVIAEVQLGATGASKHEYVLLRNNSSHDVTVNDWCVVYSDYKDETRSTLRCFVAPDGVDELRVPPRGNIFLASQTYPNPQGVVNAERFVASSTDMSGARGHIRILDAAGQEVDRLAWDNKASTPPASPELMAAVAPVTGKSIARTSVDGILVDTDDNFADFREKQSAPLDSDLFEYVKPVQVVDLCQMEGVQESMPDGFGYDEAGNCEPLASDVCLNIDKIQTVLPEGAIRIDTDCLYDVCPNLGDLQEEVPIGYVLESGTCTKLEDRALFITELLPNASGTDAGQEYIELYNPHPEAISLAGYLLAIGKLFEKEFALTDQADDEMIEPYGYRTFRDDELGFSLLNTVSGVRLIAPAGNVVSETRYENPKDDMAWVLFDDVWSYSNVPTPGQRNLPSAERDTESPVSVVTLSPCGEGKYRHPLTNRCRNIESDANVLASCDADEYRNPETNRCRKLATFASAVLADCEDGYERNPDTNRCRKVAGVSTELKECATGYERNPETNRCRAITASTNSAKTLTENTQAGASLNWPAVGAISSLAVGYALYEWRREFSQGVRAIGSRLKR